jgi:hypothetical protein
MFAKLVCKMSLVVVAVRGGNIGKGPTVAGKRVEGIAKPQNALIPLGRRSEHFAKAALHAARSRYPRRNPRASCRNARRRIAGILQPLRKLGSFASNEILKVCGNSREER